MTIIDRILRVIAYFSLDLPIEMAIWELAVIVLFVLFMGILVGFVYGVEKARIQFFETGRHKEKYSKHHPVAFSIEPVRRTSRSGTGRALLVDDFVEGYYDGR